MTSSPTSKVTPFERLAAPLIEEAAQLSSSLVCDAAEGKGALPTRIRALNGSMRLCGPAYTVALPAGDNLMLHYALSLARQGDVIVVQSEGPADCALFGDMMTAQAKAAGLGGLVVDGYCRDIDVIGRSSMPIFATGCHPRACRRELAGRIGGSLYFGDTTVEAGDLVIGDADGVVAVPRALVPELLRRAHARSEAEAGRLRDIAEGRLTPAWLPDALQRAGLATDAPPAKT